MHVQHKFCSFLLLFLSLCLQHSMWWKLKLFDTINSGLCFLALPKSQLQVFFIRKNLVFDTSISTIPLSPPLQTLLSMAMITHKFLSFLFSLMIVSFTVNGETFTIQEAMVTTQGNSHYRSLKLEFLAASSSFFLRRDSVPPSGPSKRHNAINDWALHEVKS